MFRVSQLSALIHDPEEGTPPRPKQVLKFVDQVDVRIFSKGYSGSEFSGHGRRETGQAGGHFESGDLLLMDSQQLGLATGRT